MHGWELQMIYLSCKTCPCKTKSSWPMSSHGASVHQAETRHTAQIKPKTPIYTIFKTCFHYLSLDVRSEVRQCAEESGSVMHASLWDAELSEAGFVLANSITYFNMSGSGNRAGPEPYFTYLWGRENGTLVPRHLVLSGSLCYYMKSQWKGLS